MTEYMNYISLNIWTRYLMSKDKLILCPHIAQFKTHYRDKSPLLILIDICVLRIWSYSLRIQPLHNLLSHAVLSLKPWCCQGIPSWAQEEEVHPWLEAPFVLPGALPGSAAAPWCGVEMTRRQRVTCQGTGIRGQMYYFSSGKFLTWKTACWRCAQWPHHLTSCFRTLEKVGGHKTSAAGMHAVRHIYVPPPVCDGEKP